MQALEFSLADKRLILVQKPVPTISQPRQVLIKVAYAGICGTDLHIMQGEFPCKKDGPITLGHEFSGTVVDAGAEVTEVKIGDKVVVDPNSGCQVCKSCHSGKPHFCKVGGLSNTIGIYRDGGWAQYCLVPDVQVTKLPENITLEQGALCEPISCLVHGWDKISPLTIGDHILVTGAGIIGNLWVINLHLQGHKRVTVSEPNPHRRNLLQKLKTGYDCITPEELKERHGNGQTFDVIVDCSGYAPAIENAVSLLSPGGKLCIFGVAPPMSKINISPYEIFDKELTIIGVKINPFSFPNALGRLDALGDRYLNYANLGVETFSLADYKKAIDCLKGGTIAKAVFKL